MSNSFKCKATYSMFMNSTLVQVFIKSNIHITIESYKIFYTRRVKYLNKRLILSEHVLSRHKIK